MPVITDLNAEGITITYNGVQFGGADAAIAHSTLPIYRMRGQFVYDDSGRTVKYTRYTLLVNTSFHGDSADDLEDELGVVKEKLSKPGQELKIEGLGNAFTNIDIFWGPKPLYCDWRPIGILSWELAWAVEFNICECSHPGNPRLWTAFNFDTSWTNDFEGINQRTISGHVEIAGRRAADGRTPLIVADQVRDSLNVIVPKGFRRISSQWREDAAKNRLDFSIVDAQEAGSPLPPYIIKGAGSVNFSTTGKGVFSHALVTMNLNLRVAPGHDPRLGGEIALIAAQSKFQEMVKRHNPKGKIPGSVMPVSVNITNHKFADARETQASFTWLITKCITSMMATTGIWDQVTSTSFDEWQTSVKNLWGNRGIGELGSIANEAVTVNLCNNVYRATIGDTPTVVGSYGVKEPAYKFACPDVPPQGGWIGHDLKISVHRYDPSSLHRKAISYIPKIAKALSDAVKQTLDPINLWKTHFDDSEGGGINKKHSVEYHGNPQIYVLLQFRGLRMKYMPIVPEIKSIGGCVLEPVHEHQLDAPRQVMDVGCPVFFNNGYRLYRATTYFETIKAVGNPSSCHNDDYKQQVI